jgi:GntR family transcriptional regulator
VTLVTIDPGDPTPIYAQLERGLRAAIATGRLRAGDQLPTVRQLAVDLRVNANTVARVYAELERVGVLETRRGVGSFVAAGRAATQPLHEKTRRLREFVTRVLADAGKAGVDIDDLIRELSEQRRQHADRPRSAKERSS